MSGGLARSSLLSCSFPMSWRVMGKIIIVIVILISDIFQAILCGIGIQRKSTQTVAGELGVEHSIVMGQMYELIRDLAKQVVSSVANLCFQIMLDLLQKSLKMALN